MPVVCCKWLVSVAGDYNISVTKTYYQVVTLLCQSQMIQSEIFLFWCGLFISNSISVIRVEIWCMIFMITYIPCWEKGPFSLHASSLHLGISTLYLYISPLCIAGSDISSSLALAAPTSFWAQTLCPLLDHFQYTIVLRACLGIAGKVLQGISVLQCGVHVDISVNSAQLLMQQRCPSQGLAFV